MTRHRVLLDENITVQLRLWMPRVDAASVEFMGWKSVKNGELLRAAEAAGYEVFLTVDSSIPHQQRSSSRRLATPVPEGAQDLSGA